MKKLVVLFIIFVLIFGSVNVYAAESYDSVALDKAVADSVKKDKFERVIKVYTVSFWHEVAEEKDIHQIVEDSEYRRYLVYSLCNPIYVGSPDVKHFRDGNLYDIMHYSRETAWEGDFFKYAIYPEYILGAKGHVLETYGIDAVYEGLFIYYVTDNGDYVLYKPGWDPEDDFYLFPVQVFSSVAQTAMDFYRENSGKTGFYYPTEELSMYKIKPTLFYLLIAPVMFVCFIPIIVRDRKRRRAALKKL